MTTITSDIVFELKTIIKTGNVSMDCDLDLLDLMFIYRYVFEVEGGLKVSKDGWNYLTGMKTA